MRDVFHTVECQYEAVDVTNADENSRFSPADSELPLENGKFPESKAPHVTKSKLFNANRHVIDEDEPTGCMAKFHSCSSRLSQGKNGGVLSLALIFLMLWGTLFFVNRKEALPGGNIFSLVVLVLLSEMGGRAAQVAKLPPLLGMILVGILLRSSPIIDVIGKSIQPSWSSNLRNVALVVILIRAGLGLDGKKLLKLWFVVLRLSTIPCIIETMTAAGAAYYLLDFPIMWGVMLGFLLAAVSPAVVVQGLLKNQADGLGVDQGIPTLMIGSAVGEDVLALSGFGVMLGINFGAGSAQWEAIKGVLSLGIGVSYGLIIGVLLWMIPKNGESTNSGAKFIILLGAGLLAIFGANGIEFRGAGALGALCVAFVAAIKWKTQLEPHGEFLVNSYFNNVWTYLQPLLFGLIGIQIQISQIELHTVGWGLLTVFAGLVLRMIAASFVVMGAGLNLKERLFVALAWMPKATVQAAICPAAYEMAIKMNPNPEEETEEMILGKHILTIGVLVILITAPLGAIAILHTAPILLQKTKEDKSPDDVEMNEKSSK